MAPRPSLTMLDLFVLIALIGVKLSSCEVQRKFRVAENAAPGTLIGYVQQDKAEQLSSTNHALYLFVTPPESQIEQTFSMNEVSGELRTKKQLDYESKTSYVFLAIPTDGGQGVRIIIDVVDVNDNVPKFADNVFQLQLSEYAKVNSEIPLPSATDADSGQFGVQNYELTAGNVNNAFRLSTRKLNGNTYLDLVVNGELDREFKDNYVLEVKTSDGGAPPLSATMTVNVTILDANDNAPQFDQPRYTAQIKNNASVGSSVTRVHATDKDLGANGWIEYKTTISPNEAHKYFAIDQNGLVTVAAPLKNLKQFELVVVARDKGLQSLESTSFVTITVTDVGDEPSLKLDYLSDDGTPTVSEDAEIGSFVARLSVADQTDPSKDYRRLNFTISGGDDYFGVQSSDGVIYILLAKRLNRELRNNYTLILAATDSQASVVLRRKVEIRVGDVNDNPPQFTRSVYEGEISEKATSGTSVLQVKAFDRDEGLNGDIAYSLSPTSALYASWFEIDEDTGLITTADSIDCEISSKPEFVVVAKDKGEMQMSSSAKVVITVLDFNDNAPIFDRTIYNVTIKEDVDVGTCFLKVSSTDPDCGVNAQIRYAIPQEALERNVFSLNEKTGSLCTVKPLDYETRNSYQFLIAAYDGGGLSTSSLVVVTVEDVNDNVPIFYPSAYNVSLRQNSQPGVPMLIVSAVDLDSGEFGVVSYRIASGDDQHLFRMDAKKGVLYVEANLSPTVYQLTVQAIDGGNLVAAQPAVITVTVLTNDYPSPTFNEKLYKVTVREDTLPGIAVIQVQASGPGTIAYSIYSGDPNGYFEIDKSSGKIMVDKYLDYEKQDSYLLNVQAALGSPSSYNHTQVQILVEDINDNVPIFDQTYVRVSLAENHDLQKVFFICKASDKDSDKNGKVKYKLLNNYDGVFLLHVVTGELRLNKPLDYESKHNYTLVVVAQDGGMPPFSSNMTLEIDVLDVNDHMPIFVESALKFVVPENTAVMTRIGQLMATDADSGSNGRLTYKLSGGDANAHFGVFGDSGWIYVRKPLDRESIEEYTLTVTAKDGGEPSKTATGTVKVEVSDVNDNAPNCSTVQEFYVEENIASTTYVGVLRAIDADAGKNGSISFLVVDNVDLFRVNDKGELFSEKPLDREVVHRYDLKVLARDNGTPSLSSSCSVIVHVTDVNDNAPNFILPHQDRIFYREQQRQRAEVVQVRANDPDNGENGTVKYKLEPENAAPFTINADTGLITSDKVFDFESDNHVYNLNVIAEDRGIPVRRAVRSLTVELLDVADGSHSKNVSLTFEISETMPVGTQVGKVDDSIVEANEIESFERLSDVEFSIVSGNSFGVFEIDRSTSVLYLIKRLDYETQSSHFLVINRLDLTTSYPKSTTMNVKILVIDENDNAPQFPEDPVIFSVPENAQINQLVWVFNATDADTGSFGRVQYKIIEQSPEPAFSVDVVSGELKIVRALDFERFKEYILVVEAEDQAANLSQRNRNKVTTRVYVTDINDNKPVFVSREEVSVFEDEPVGFPIVFLAATDKDWLENGRVTYSIQGDKNKSGKFAVNTTSGALTLIERLDRESAREFNLIVVAQDHGNPSLSTTQNLKINVVDINDNAPRFDKPVYRATVVENMPAATTVVQLKAVDVDKGTNSELVYILPPAMADNKFRIDEKSGVITTFGPLDREQVDQYILTVYVRDSSSYPVRYDATSVIVNVDDVNDNSPIFTNSSCFPMSVPENRRFQSLHSLIAIDKDVGLNGRITYSIAGGNVDGKFAINATTGELSCESLDRETIAAYNLTILARDGGTPSLSDACTLTVHVLDENDNSPVFDQPSYSIEVAENASPGKVIFNIQAKDADQGANGRVSYSLINETFAMFDINPETGDLQTISHLDFEVHQSYSFFVEASDQGPSEPRRTLVPVNVKILDVNDNAPVFVEIPFVVNVTGEIAAGQRVVKVTAIDADGPGPNSEIFYGFLNTSYNDMYGINPTTGVISAKQNIRLPSGTVQYLNIYAVDKGEPPLQTVGIVEVVVAGSLTVSPLVRFEKTRYDVKVEEHTAKGTTVGQVKANGGSEAIRYAISGRNDMNAFGIDAQTGRVFVVDGTHLDFEKSGRLQLILEAKSGQNSAFVGMTVEVQDVNDHSPQFLQQRYRTAIWEGKARGAYVVQVSATDDDYGENAQITYSIVSGNLDSAFTIDNNGVARTNAELDREIVDHYTLTVMATDYGTPPRSGTTVIDVQVVDVNDNSPSFPPSRLLKISENAEIGTLLTTITANDVDTYPTLTYSFTADGNPGEYFALGKFSGRLTLLRRLDFETQKEISLQIQVSDEVHIVVAKQRVMVLDENDNAPAFVQQFYQVSVPVDTPGGTSVVQVSANDADSGANGEVSYFLGEIVPATPGFWIDSDSGAIYINQTITAEMEKAPLLQLSVLVRDHGSPQRTTFTSVQVQIVGKSVEEQAKFTKAFYNFSIPEGTLLHSIVGKVSVTTDSKHLLFGIKSGDPSRTFSVNADGSIILMKPVDRETIDEYRLQITVQTKINSVSNSSSTVLIKIDDVNDNTPTFERREFRATLTESSPIGTQVIQMSATDADIGDNGKLRYEITSGDPAGRFEIEPETGVIKVKSVIAYEDMQGVRLIVMVADNGQQPRSALTSVVVSIVDDGEKSLFFPLPLYIGRVAENEPSGILVFSVKAVSRDGTDTNKANYSIIGEESAQFSISPSTGEVRTTASFDYEIKTSYRFSIRATDSKGRRATVPGQVMVKGVDEYAPEFAGSKFFYQVPLDANSGDMVGVIYATDRDSGFDGQITYLIREPTAYFAINPSTGMIVVTQSLLPLVTNQTKPIGDRSTENLITNNANSKLTLTVVAYSGQDPAIGKSNTTSVELELGYFAKGSSQGNSLASTAITVSSVLLVIIVIVLLIVLLKLRCRNDKPSSVNKISYPKQTLTKTTTTPSTVAPRIPGRSPKATPVIINVADRTQSGKTATVALPTQNRRTHPLNSVSNWSAKSSGRGSVTVDDEDEEIRRLTSSASDRSHNARSGGPDSGIHLFPEDNGSIGSELPSTQEYLTSLGVVSTCASNVNNHSHHDVNRIVNVGKMEALEQYLEAQDCIADGVDVQELIYSKVSEVLADDGDVGAAPSSLPDIMSGSKMRASVSSTLPDFSDSVMRNPWTLSTSSYAQAAPTFQPVTQVIAKAARAERDSLPRRRPPTASDSESFYDASVISHNLVNNNNVHRTSFDYNSDASATSSKKLTRPTKLNGTAGPMRSSNSNEYSSPSPNVWLPQHSFPATPEASNSRNSNIFNFNNNFDKRTSNQLARKDSDDSELEIKI